MKHIDRIIIAEGNVKGNLKKALCKECGREYFMAVASDGSVVQPCPVCLGLFEDESKN